MMMLHLLDFLPAETVETDPLRLRTRNSERLFYAIYYLRIRSPLAREVQHEADGDPGKRRITKKERF